MPWYHLTTTKPKLWERRLDELEPVHTAFGQQSVGMRSGQALEIAVLRTLQAQSALDFVGNFHDLDEHDDSELYTKEDPPRSYSGRAIPDDSRLDFFAIHDTAGLAGIEVKNVREWIYPDRPEVLDFLKKCLCLDAVPVLIARRIPYVTFATLNPCGVIIHQTYNQRMANADRDLGEQAKDKNLLGYHDIRFGNETDDRLQTFLHKNLPRILPQSRKNFDLHRKYLEKYVEGEWEYWKFARKITNL